VAKKKLYISIDSTIDGKDYLKQALGCVQYEETSSYEIPEPPPESLKHGEVWNSEYTFYTKFGDSNRKLNADLNSTFVGMIEDHYGTTRAGYRAFINNSLAKNASAATSRTSTYGTENTNIYRSLMSLEINPARLVPVDENKVLPNFKIPCRIFSNPTYPMSDKSWQTMWLGGEINNTVYKNLVDPDTVFYDHSFLVTCFDDQLDLLSFTGMPGIGASDPFTLDSELGMSVRGQYKNYNKWIQKYQDWESDKHELLLPSLMFEANYVSEQASLRSDIAAAVSGDWDTTYGETEQTEVRKMLNTKVGEGLDRWPWVYYLERMNDYPSYYTLFNYYFPLSLTNITLNPDISVLTSLRTLSSETFLFYPTVASARPLPNFLSDELARSNDGPNTRLETKMRSDMEVDQWYGDYWINAHKPRDLENKVKHVQKNVMFAQSYWGEQAYLRGGGFNLRQNYAKIKIDSAYGDITGAGTPPQSANNKGIVINLKRHQPFDMGNYLTREQLHSVVDKTARRLLPKMLQGENRYNFPWNIRKAIEVHQFSGKFLETLKDIDNNNFTNFKYKTFPLKLSSEVDQPIHHKDGAVTSYNKKETSEVKLEGFDFVNYLLYMLNNYGEAVNDDFVFLGGRDSTNGATYSDNLLYRFSNTKSLLKVMDSTLDSLDIYTRYLQQSNIDKVINVETGTGFSLFQELVYKNLFNPRLSFTECLSYKIEKSIAGNNIQNWWVWNSTEDANENSLVINDSQVKYGKDYTYMCYGYFIVLSHKYKYSDFRLTKQTNNYDTNGDGVVDKYCVEFYEPLSKLVAPQVFSIASSEGKQPDSVEYHDLAQYNSFATSEYDISDSPQLADFHLNIEPCFKVIKVPLFKKTCAVFDNPGNKITAVPFHIIDNQNKIGFNISQDSWKQSPYPVCLNQKEVELRTRYLNSKDLFLTNNIKQVSESPARYLEVYRTDKKPNSYYDFNLKLVSKIDLRIPGENYNRTEYTFADKITPNKKYYYLFRYITENGMPGHPSTIYECKLADDGGYKYALFDTVDTSKFGVEENRQTNTTFKKIFQIEPNIKQMQLNFGEADFRSPANTQLDKVTVGATDSKIWDKKFKIRLTSKKSGKILDLNLKFNLHDKDLS
tara:strand:+ start:1715 stop:5071 length:3357 start_codon:yes stop_codon:yes gene_type:complete